MPAAPATRKRGSVRRPASNTLVTRCSQTLKQFAMDSPDGGRTKKHVDLWSMPVEEGVLACGCHAHDRRLSCPLAGHASVLTRQCFRSGSGSPESARQSPQFLFPQPFSGLWLL